jgi:citrate synthase
MIADTFLTATAAADRLGVSKRTLYAYVSRGLLSSEAGPGPSRARRYPASAVDALRADRERRADRRLAAHGALHWGLPVVDSALTLIEGGHLYYRGEDATTLSRSSRFEDACWTLWQDPGRCPDIAASVPPDGRQPANPIPRMADHLTRQARTSVITMGSLATRDAGPALRVVAGLFAALGATGRGSLAERLADGWEVPERADDINGALVLCADHELNISAFTARCVASADARLEYVLLAALCAFSGGRHGGATEAVAALFRDARTIGPVRAIDRALTGGSLPGFGHPLYPDGDPRGSELIARARQIGDLAPDIEELIGIVAEQLGLRPTVDAGLVVLAESAGLPPDAAPALFALGRSAGWIAHALEGASDDQLIRPRARYVGPAPH